MVLDAHGHTLPSLPVPPLSQTLARFLVTAKPLLTDEEFARTFQLAAEFVDFLRATLVGIAAFLFFLALARFALPIPVMNPRLCLCLSDIRTGLFEFCHSRFSYPLFLLSISFTLPQSVPNTHLLALSVSPLIFLR